MPEVRPEIEAVVTDFIKRLERRGIRLEQVYLFGSHLKGGVDEWSDIDLIVVSKDFADVNYWDLMSLLGEAERETFEATGKMIETHAKTPEQIATCHPASFRGDVLKDAVVVYDRTLAHA